MFIGQEPHCYANWNENSMILGNGGVLQNLNMRQMPRAIDLHILYT